LLSINRFERKKNIALAIHALDQLKQKLKKRYSTAQHTVHCVLTLRSQFDQLHLVIAGGYDPRVSENVEHKAELEQIVQSLGLDEKVTFLPSLSEEEKNELLWKSFCVIYTPANEHFGIVPLEAMQRMKPGTPSSALCARVYAVVAYVCVCSDCVQ
jgi:alpha-1,3/alpha-1,6-mannosyltransferase